MVQLKYFGDSRDYFKYDLIKSLITKTSLKNYVFVPMLTEHRPDNEGNKSPHYTRGKSRELLTFISAHKDKSLRHWETWLSPCLNSYKTIEPIDETFFNDETRTEYWDLFNSILGSRQSMIFVDPDTGLETGPRSYMKKAGLEKYILNNELGVLISKLKPTSALMIYQQLQHDSHKHLTDIQKKLKQVKAIDSHVLVSAYKEGDLAFIIIAKRASINAELIDALKEYHSESIDPNKSLHLL